MGVPRGLCVVLEADMAFGKGLIQAVSKPCSGIVQHWQGLGASGTIISAWLLSKTGFLNGFLTANSGRLSYQQHWFPKESFKRLYHCALGQNLCSPVPFHGDFSAGTLREMMGRQLHTFHQGCHGRSSSFWKIPNNSV